MIFWKNLMVLDSLKEFDGSWQFDIIQYMHVILNFK